MSAIHKTLIWGGQVSLAVLDTTQIVNEAIRRHGLTPVAAAALGRTMSATAYLCSWLKADKSTLSVSIEGGGVGGKIRTAGDGALNVRGFAENPGADLPPRPDGKLNVGAFVGNTGSLTVVRDDGDGLPFAGTSALVSGEIAEDFSAYFLTSEQRPTAIALGVLIGTDGSCSGAGGVFLQPLPGASEETLRRTEEEIAKFSNISARIFEEGAEAILRSFSPESRVDTREIRFRCRCSRARVGALIVSLGRKEAESILSEYGTISVHCHDCNTTYDFGREETAALFDREESHEG